MYAFSASLSELSVQWDSFIALFNLWAAAAGEHLHGGLIVGHKGEPLTWQCSFRGLYH